MNKILALVLAIVMLATMGGVALAQVDPAEVNIVLPDGETANIPKDVTIGDVGTVDVWGEVAYPEGQTGLSVKLTSVSDVTGPTTVTLFVVTRIKSFLTETIMIDAGGPKYATVTFYYGEDDVDENVIGTQEISVTEGNLDIKPGSYPNSINRKKNGVTPVAILGTRTFDVKTIDVSTIEFGPNEVGPAHDLTDEDVLADHIQDVNFDGNLDLVCHFKTKAAGLPGPGDSTADLTYDSITISDSIHVIK